MHHLLDFTAGFEASQIKISMGRAVAGNLARLLEYLFQKSRTLYQDVTCNRSVSTMLVQILLFERCHAFPQALYRGTSLIKTRPPAYDHHRAQGIGLL